MGCAKPGAAGMRGRAKGLDGQALPPPHTTPSLFPPHARLLGGAVCGSCQTLARQGGAPLLPTWGVPHSFTTTRLLGGAVCGLQPTLVQHGGAPLHPLQPPKSSVYVSLEGTTLEAYLSCREGRGAPQPRRTSVVDLGSWRLRCAHAAVQSSGGYGCTPRVWRSRTPKAIPSAVHPFGALGGNGSRGGGSPCTRWLADYRYRCRLM